jgi:hypothetical protein
MLYVKASTAAKSGGFAAARIIIPGYFEYDDETALGFELGYKASFAGDRGQLNVAAFHAGYDDLQVNSFDPDSAYLTNSTLDPLAAQGAYARVNARAGVGAADGKWTVVAIGRNLGGEKLNNHTEAFLGVYRGYMQEPRTVWLQGIVRFGS